MPLADSVPKMNAPKGDEEYGSYEGLAFCVSEEAIGAAFARTAGKVLLVSDEESCFLFAAAARSPRAISVVLDADCLPLFSMPEIGCVLGAGGKKTLFAARFFSSVMRIPCTLFPTVATLAGALERKGEVSVGGETLAADFRSERVICDLNLLAPTLGRAYARLLLARLQAFEGRALRLFGREAADLQGGEPPRLSENAEELIRENARVGDLIGEGGALAALLEGEGERVPEWRAYLQLTALYAAFFTKGKPRRYYTPDYKARANKAGTAVSYRIPTAEEYARRAIALERMRAEMTAAILAFTRRREEYFQTVRSLSPEGMKEGGGDLTKLKYLPEYREGGLSTVIRDFGLMEW